jgi:lysophospholipase L1-like esterase
MRLKNKLLFSFFAICLLQLPQVWAQTNVDTMMITNADSISVSATTFSFVKNELNYLINPKALESFYQKLEELKSGRRNKLVIVHIGDSHIQADNFTGTMRKQLQQQFGNGGRGLYFPYRTAKTNGPFDIKDINTSICNWKSKRCVFPAIPIPIGISGITIQANQSAKIDFSLSQNYGENKFDKLTIFCDKKFAYTIEPQIQDPVTNFFVSPFRLEYAADPYSLTYSIDNPISSVRLNIEKSDTSSEPFNLFGVYFQNTEAKGIEYNMIGVNGAQYMHYNLADYFFEQLQTLQPDLIIVSLGTNEAISRGYNAATFESDANEFFSKLNDVLPNSSVLVTSPPDTYMMRKYKNIHTSSISNIQQRICLKNNYAFWDFYNIMGGLGSVIKWRKLGMGNSDMLHFLQKGYEVQGTLLYRALMNSYNNHNRNR